ncbi:MAG: ABC transporter ATP-binding protein, partial [Anaerotignum sp.]|nr:ABC transporter ATP-binding protein [Anaerotignum sp.]
GVMSPNTGTVERNYKTINLLALGVGFSEELSGMENIYLNGMLLGFKKKQIEKVKQDIIEFSELGDFIYRPMKTYSSGMVSRLGFSIAIHLKPEVLLIDEVLSVGDAKFQLKSFEALKQIISDENVTVAIVSHALNSLRQICDKIIWLEKGEVVAQGDITEVLSMYDDYNKGKITMAQVREKSLQQP